MAFRGWARRLPYVLGIDDPWSTYPNVKRLLDEIDALLPSVSARGLSSAGSRAATSSSPRRTTASPAARAAW